MDDSWGYTFREGLEPNDYAIITGWTFNPKIAGRLVKIAHCGPGGNRSFNFMDGAYSSGLNFHFLKPASPIDMIAALAKEPTWATA